MNKAASEALRGVDFQVRKGEVRALMGDNGAGKSTFLKMLVRQVESDTGNVKLARDLDFSYFDQDRTSLKKGATIKEFLCENDGDQVTMAGGKTRHVCGYMSDFLFDPKDVDTLISTLSGGQQNRLFLAKTLANPGNFLILDEPTNDLDMESLDILEDYLCKYKGTLIVVSHDRDFLDNVATSILAFEGGGKIFSNLGGYSDYLQYRKSNSAESSGSKSPAPTEKAAKKDAVQAQNSEKQNQKEIRKLRSEEGRKLRRTHQAHAALLKQKFRDAGLPLMESDTHIVPLLVGDPEKCKALSDTLLFDFGIYVQPINYPTVPVGSERLRITPTPFHSVEDIRHLAEALCDLWSQCALARQVA